MSDSVVIPWAKVPLACDDGAINVTVTPLTGTPALKTPASSCVENGVPTFALCCDPLTETIVNTDVDRLVRLNVADADALETAADTA
jgi:serine/threonine protein phosphatase PrpC